MKKAKRSLRISSGPLINYVLLKFKLQVYHFHLFEPIKKDASRVHSMLSHTLLFCLTVFFLDTRCRICGQPFWKEVKNKESVSIGNAAAIQKMRFFSRSIPWKNVMRWFDKCHQSWDSTEFQYRFWNNETRRRQIDKRKTEVEMQISVCVTVMKFGIERKTFTQPEDVRIRFFKDADRQ